MRKQRSPTVSIPSTRCCKERLKKRHASDTTLVCIIYYTIPDRRETTTRGSHDKGEEDKKRIVDIDKPSTDLDRKREGLLSPSWSSTAP